MSPLEEYLDLSAYPPFSPPTSPPQDISHITDRILPFNAYPFPRMGSTTPSDAVTNMNAQLCASHIINNDPALVAALQEEWFGSGSGSGSDSSSGSHSGFDSALWEGLQQVYLERLEEVRRRAEDGPFDSELPVNTDVDMDTETHEGANVEETTGVDVNMDIDATNANTGIGFEPSFTEFTQLLSPLNYGTGGSGSGFGSGSESTSSSPLSEVPSTPPSSHDSSSSISGPSSSHAPMVSPRKARASQVSAQPLVTRASSRLKPFDADAADELEEMDQDRHRLWGQKSTVLIGQGYALKACQRISLDDMVLPAYVARNSNPLDAWHAGHNYYPVPSAPELALLKKSSGPGTQLSQAVSRRGAPCFIGFESVNQFGPGVALIEALNDRDVASSNSWPAFDFGGARSGEIIPFWPGYGEGNRIQIRRGMRFGEVAGLIAQEYHACWKRWGEMTVSSKDHLGYRVADSTHTRRTTAIDFSQVRLRGLFSLGGGEPYYAQLVVKIP